MAEYRYRLWGFAFRRSKMLLLTIFVLLNFVCGLLIIVSAISKGEGGIHQLDIIRRKLSLIPSISSIPTRKSIKDQYDYYFRIDYTINQAVCKPLRMFNTSTNIASIQTLTNATFNTLLTQTTDIDVISINPILKRTYKIKDNSAHVSAKIVVCDYILELYVGFDFPVQCDTTCQSHDLVRLAIDTQPFGDPVDDYFLFNLYSSNKFRSKIEFTIEQILLYRSSRYYAKSVYIRSFYEDRYVTISVLDSAGYQTAVGMAEKQRSLFVVKDGLDLVTSGRNNRSTICVSFLSLLPRDTYLRHEDGRIKLGKIDQISPLKPYATFKLLMSKGGGDMVAFESTNSPRSYIAVGSELNTTLVLEYSEQRKRAIEYFDQRFLFRLHYNE